MWWAWWYSTPPVYVSISFTSMLTSTAPLSLPPSAPPLASTVSPRKSLVRRSLLSSLIPIAESSWLTAPNSPVPSRVTWLVECCCCTTPTPTTAAEEQVMAPTVAAFWSNAVADVAALEKGTGRLWRCWRSAGGEGKVVGSLWKVWASGLMWRAEAILLTMLGFSWDDEFQGLKLVTWFWKLCWFGKRRREWSSNGFPAVANWVVDSLALSSANASQNALWVMKLSFLQFSHN